MNNDDLLVFINELSDGVKNVILNLTSKEIEDIYVNANMHVIHIGETKGDPFIAIGLESEKFTMITLDNPFSKNLTDWIKVNGESSRLTLQNLLIEKTDKRLSELGLNYEDYPLEVALTGAWESAPDKGVVFSITFNRSIAEDVNNSFEWAEPDETMVNELVHKTIAIAVIGIEVLKDYFYELHLSQSK